LMDGWISTLLIHPSISVSSLGNAGSGGCSSNCYCDVSSMNFDIIHMTI
jgi:hypothetical protein